MDKFLIFNSHFDRDKGLDQGRLSFCSLLKGTELILIACSSYSTKQYKESFHERGGKLPPEYRTPDLKYWQVETKPVFLPDHKGVRGNFYRLLPFQVKTDKGGVRSDFGIHLDANRPGSLGCIVMSKHRFEAFEEKMSDIKNEGIKRLPLFVRYS